IGIIMLASLGIVGITDIHIANGIKNILGMTINCIASVYFLFSGHVLWSYAFLMMLGFALGGYAGARLSLRFDRKKVKLFVVTWGLLLSLFFFLKAYQA
ncbi:MAG: TSUP family transporter, partial [Hydrogenobacter sp.]